MRRAIATAVLLAPLCAIAPAARAQPQVQLDMRADRTSITAGDRVRVQITVETQGGESPEVELPDFDGFDILSRQVQRPMQFSFSFGSRAVVKSSTIYGFVLSPLRAGRLRIEPARVRIGGEVYATDPLEIEVAPGAGLPPQAQVDPNSADPQADPQAATPEQAPAIDGAEIDPMAFVRTVIDKSEPYVGEQITVTIYLYFRQRLQSPPTIESEPSTDGFWTHDLIGPTHAFQAERQAVNGVFYHVYVLRRFAAFPLRSGELVIGPLSLSIDTSSVFDLFGSRRSDPVIRRSGTTQTLNVKPLPEQGHPGGEVAVGDFSLSAELDRHQTVGGDAVTLTAVVSGRGNVRTVRLKTPDVAGADVLEPQVREQVEAPNDRLGGTREYRWLIVPREQGELRVPAITLHTFDPARGYRTLTTEPMSIEVVGDPSALRATPTPGRQPAKSEQSADTPPRQFGPIRTQSALQRTRTPLARRAFYPWALIAPPLLWLLWVGGTGLRRRLRERASNGPLRALRDAEQRLHAAQQAASRGEGRTFHGAAEASVLSALEAKLGEGVRGLTRAQLRAQLAERGMPDELVARVVELLERSEYARFGSSEQAAGELREQARRLEQVFRGIGTWQPAVEEHAA